MCGIAGVLSRARVPDRGALERMAAALSHRGPDEFGLYRDLQCGLAHARLSIIDLASGQQPLCNEDGTLWVVFNGEIFNYVELREELVAKGHAFRTKSDTEVIVHAWEEWREGCFSRFDGQWAIALWDARREELVLCRDPVGVRPLHVCEHDGAIWFASEVRAIFAADPAIPRSLDPFALDQTFTFWSPIAPRSAFAGVEELRPGWLRIYANGGMREAPHFAHHYRARGDVPELDDVDASAQAVLAALRKATALRMLRADVPVGSYLSGGLDSSLIAALGLEAKGSGFSTFSIRFSDSDYDETRFQRMMAERLGTEHHEIVVDRSDVSRVFPEVIAHGERPILRTAPAPLFMLSGLVHDLGTKVVLTGEGADEVFAGYDLFREAKVRRFWARQPDSKLRPMLLDRLYPWLVRSPFATRKAAMAFFGRELSRANEPGFSHRPRWSTARTLRRLFSKEQRAATEAFDPEGELLATLPAEFARWSPLGQDQYLEVRTLLSGYLLSSQGDRMLMAHSVEGRFPFLDREVMALAEQLPPEHKLRVLDEKHVLKRAAKGLVPDEIRQRPKQPYRAPDALSFVGESAPAWIDEVLSPSAIAEAGVFDASVVQQLVKKVRANAAARALSNVDNMALVGVLSTQLLHRSHVQARIAPRGVAFRTVIDRVAREAA